MRWEMPGPGCNLRPSQGEPESMRIFSHVGCCVPEHCWAQPAPLCTTHPFLYSMSPASSGWGEVIQFPPRTSLPSLLSLHRWICPHQHTHCRPTLSLPWSMAVAGLLPLPSSHHLPSPSRESTRPPSSIFRLNYSSMSAAVQKYREETWRRDTLGSCRPAPGCAATASPPGLGSIRCNELQRPLQHSAPSPRHQPQEERKQHESSSLMVQHRQLSKTPAE